MGTMHAARFSPGVLFLPHSDHQCPVPTNSRGERCAPRGGAGPRVEQHSHRYPLFTSLPKLRPVARDRRIEIKFATRGEHMSAQGGRAFGRRPDECNCILAPGCLCIGMSHPAPQVHDCLAIEGDADRCSNLAPLLEITREFPGYPFESRIAESRDLASVNAHFDIGKARHEQILLDLLILRQEQLYVSGSMW